MNPNEANCLNTLKMGEKIRRGTNESNWPPSTLKPSPFSCRVMFSFGPCSSFIYPTNEHSQGFTPHCAQLSGPKTVTETYKRYFHRGISVKTIELPNSTTTTTTARRAEHTNSVAAAGGERDQVTSFKVHMASSTTDAADDRIPRIASTIRVIQDFLKPGIQFQDITTLLLDLRASKDAIDLFVERYKDQNINVVAGQLPSFLFFFFFLFSLLCRFKYCFRVLVLIPLLSSPDYLSFSFSG